MANTKTSDLTATTGATTDILYVVSGSNSRQLTVANLITGASLTTATNTQTLTNKTLTSPTINTPALGAGSVDAITEIASALKSGSDVTLITGTKGTSGDLALWNADGDLVDGPTPPSGTIVGHTDTQTLSNKTYQNAALSGDANITSSTGNITVAGADPKRGLYVPSSAMYGATTSGAASGQYESATNKVNVRVLDFDTSADEYACFNIPAPDYWDLSTITFQPHWTAASGSGTVCFALQGLARSNDDALDTAYGTAQTSTDTLITALDEHIGPASSAITIGGTPAKGDMLYLRIYRDVSGDDLGVDARLLGIRIKFGISQFDDA